MSNYFNIPLCTSLGAQMSHLWFAWFGAQGKRSVLHHTHLELPAQCLCKLGNKCMRRATKNDIIHVYLNQESFSALLEEEQSFINWTHCKTHLKQEIFQALIPGSRGLLQTIQGFVDFKNMVGELRIFKARGLPNINLFLYVPIQESTLQSIWYSLNPFEAANTKRILMASKWAIGAKVSS